MEVIEEEKMSSSKISPKQRRELFAASGGKTTKAEGRYGSARFLGEPERQAAAGDRDTARLESALGGSVASILHKDPTLDFLGNNIIVDNYNSLSRLKESKNAMVMDEDGNMQSEYHIKYQ